jgi:hypothetical protein
MAALTFVQALRKHRIAIAPTLHNRGSTRWFAGQRSLNGDGLTNIILPGRRVDDKGSPEEAVQELLVILDVGDTLADSVEVKEAPPEPPPVQLSMGEPDIVEEDGKFVLRLPDGRVYRASRRRDLVRKAKLVA